MSVVFLTNHIAGFMANFFDWFTVEEIFLTNQITLILVDPSDIARTFSYQSVLFGKDIFLANQIAIFLAIKIPDQLVAIILLGKYL